MTIETRLATMREYLAKAVLHPIVNKLYIEDLNLSIAMFEKAARNKNSRVIVQKGFDLSE